MLVFSQKSQEMKWQRRISARENHTALPCRHVHDKLGPLWSPPPFSSCDVCTITRPKPTSGCRSRSRSRSVVRLNARFRFRRPLFRNLNLVAGGGWFWHLPELDRRKQAILPPEC